MSFFDEMKESLVSAGKDVSQKAKEVSGVAKLKLDVKSKEDYVEKQYAELGRTYFDAHKMCIRDRLYTIFSEYGAIARSVCIKNAGKMPLHLLTAMSLNLDLPDKDYIWMQLSGAWARERHVKVRALEQGITAIDSMRGHSSHEQNPFMVLKRKNTDEVMGEAIGFSFIYSGNFRIQAEVDTHCLLYTSDWLIKIDLDVDMREEREYPFPFLLEEPS